MLECKNKKIKKIQAFSWVLIFGQGDSIEIEFHQFIFAKCLCEWIYIWLP